MTLGEKIKESRKQTGLSQEDLSIKLCVSRSAVAKWETDKGIPDINNLKAISALLNVSIDYLLDDECSLTFSAMREAYVLPKKLNWHKKVNFKIKMMFKKYPNAKIIELIPKKLYSKKENIFRSILDTLYCFTNWELLDLPIYTALMVKDDLTLQLSACYFLIEENNKQTFVKVTDNYIETSPINELITDKAFEIGNVKFEKIIRNEKQYEKFKKNFIN